MRNSEPTQAKQLSTKSLDRIQYNETFRFLDFFRYFSIGAPETTGQLGTRGSCSMSRPSPAADLEPQADVATGARRSTDSGRWPERRRTPAPGLAPGWRRSRTGSGHPRSRPRQALWRVARTSRACIRRAGEVVAGVRPRSSRHGGVALVRLPARAEQPQMSVSIRRRWATTGTRAKKEQMIVCQFEVSAGSLCMERQPARGCCPNLVGSGNANWVYPPWICDLQDPIGKVVRATRDTADRLPCQGSIH